MLKQLYGWVLLFGSVMVLLAVALLVHSHTAAAQTSIPSRLHVQDAVTHLEKCLTCHSSELALTVYQPVNLHKLSEIQAQPVDVAELPELNQLQAEVDSQLVDLGHRILDLPETDSQAYQAVAENFLQVYGKTRLETDRDTLLGALHSLSELEYRLRLLEHQASPDQWDVVSEAPIKGLLAMALSSPPALLYGVLASWTPLIYPNIEYRSYHTDTAFEIPSLVRFAVHRRGPPEDLHMESILPGRLPSLDGQSPFYSLDCPFAVSQRAIPFGQYKEVRLERDNVNRTYCSNCSAAALTGNGAGKVFSLAKSIS